MTLTIRSAFKATGVALILVTSSCTLMKVPKPPTPSRLQETDPWERTAWIEKAAKVLRNGEGLGANDDVDALLALSDEEIVATLMTDWRFADTVLNFNLYFLGRSINKLRSPSMTSGSYVYDDAVYQTPQALTAARAAVDGGDFFELFSMSPLGYLPPLGAPGKTTTQSGNFDDAAAQGLKNDLTIMFEQYYAGFGTPPNRGSVCSSVESIKNANLGLAMAGFDPLIEKNIKELWLAPICSDVTATGDMAFERLKGVQKGLTELVDRAGALKTTTPMVTSINDLKPVNLSFQNLAPIQGALSVKGFWEPLRNSSTNFNRKRAAYMLRTYFCDDLTPIKLELPAQHMGDGHATDPTCQACHYKLDPMAALFRFNGMRGNSFEGQAVMTFDDNKTINGGEYTKYMDSWKREDGTLKAGYFVAPDKAHAAWQGDRLEDFFKFARKSKEVRQCMTRRLAEYFLGPDQVYDGDWLSQIGKYLDGADSGAGFKKAVKTLVLSKTFAKQDPVQGECYDFASATINPNRPPCEVASTIKNKCQSCHNADTMADSGNLDMSKWSLKDDGKQAFEHLDDNGVQRPSNESFAMIQKRLTGTELGPQMPLAGSMSPVERQALYKWLETLISAQP